MKLTRFFKIPKHLIYKITIYRRKAFYGRLRKRLKNPAPTIIANNCFGTFIYYNLNLRFSSPTINLTMTHDDFLDFAQNLKSFLAQPLKEEAPRSFPVGSLEYEGRKIFINFVHYKSFEEACAAWVRRTARVEFENIYIVMQDNTLSKEYADKFDSLPYKNKMLVLGQNPNNSPNFVLSKISQIRPNEFGQVLLYKSKYSAKRWMDDIDYVSFLNRGHKNNKQENNHA